MHFVCLKKQSGLLREYSLLWLKITVPLHHIFNVWWVSGQKKNCCFLKLNQFYLFCQNHLGLWMTPCWKNFLNNLELGAVAFVQLSVISTEGKETRSLLGSYFSQKLQLNLYTFWLHFPLCKSSRVRAKILLFQAPAIGCNIQESTRRNNKISDKKTHSIMAKLLWLSQNHKTKLSHQLGTFLQ